MWVSELRLSHFRNHSSTILQLAPGVTTFVGSNGQGKTNIVESLVYLSQLSSHRAGADDALVQQGWPEAEVRSVVRNDGRQVNLGLTVRASGANRSTVNGQPVSLGEMSSWIKVVFFSPEDMALIRGEPSVRRRLLDTALAGAIPRYRTILSEYDKVTRQKNTLLKGIRQRRTPHSETETLTVWNDTLARLGAEISWGRHQLIEQWGPLVQAAYEAIAPGDTVTLGIDWSDSQWNDACFPRSLEELTERYRLSIRAVERGNLTGACHWWGRIETTWPFPSMTCRLALTLRRGRRGRSHCHFGWDWLNCLDSRLHRVIPSSSLTMCSPSWTAIVGRR